MTEALQMLLTNPLVVGMWLGLNCLCVLILVVDFFRKAEISFARFTFWTLAVLILGPLGLLIFWRGRRKLGRRLLQLTVMTLLFFGISGSAIYLARDAIAGKFQRTLERRLAKKGVFLEYKASQLDPMHGLVLSDVTLFRQKTKREAILSLSRMAINYRVDDLILSGRDRMVDVTFTNATLTAFHQKKPFSLERLTGAVEVREADANIKRLHGHFHGLDLDLAGRVDLDDEDSDEEEEKDEKDPKKKKRGPSDMNLEWVSELAETLQLKSSSTAPLLKVRFYHEEFKEREEEIRLHGTFEARDFSWRDVPIDRVFVDFESGVEPKPKDIHISQFRLEYKGGAATGKGLYEPDGEWLHIEEMDSQLDPIDLAAALSPEEDDEDFAFVDAPRVLLSGHVSLENPEKTANFRGQARCARSIVYQGDGRSLALNNFALTFHLVDGIFETADFTGQALGGAVQAAMRVRPFERPAGYEGKVKIDGLSLAEWTKFEGAKVIGQGEVDVEVEVMSQAIMGSKRRPNVLFSPFTLTHKGKSLTASGRLRDQENILELDRVVSGLDPLLLCADLNPEEKNTDFSFLDAPHLELSGKLHLKRPESADFTGKLTGTRSIVHQGDDKTLALNDFSLSFKLAEGIFETTDFTGKALGGLVTSSMKVRPFEKPAGFVGRVKIDELSLAEWSKYQGAKKEGVGLVNVEAYLTSKAVPGMKRPNVMFAPFILQHEERKLTSSGVYHDEEQILQLDDLESNLDALRFIARLGGTEPPKDLRFLSPPTLSLSGEVPLRQPELANLIGAASCEEGIAFLFPEKRELRVQNLTSTFTLSEGSLQFPDINGKALGGHASGNIAVTCFAEVPEYTGSIDAKGLSLQEVSRFAGSPDERVGVFSGTFTGTGTAGPAGFRGEGSLRIDDADFVSIPVFRTLQPLMVALTPATWQGKQKGSSLTATYSLAGSSFLSQDIVMEGAFFTINGALWTDFSTERIQAKGLARSRAAGGLVAELAGSTLEVEADGKYDNYQWRLKNVPGLGNVGQLTEMTEEALTAAFKSAGAAGEVGLKVAGEITNVGRDAARAASALLGLRDPDAVKRKRAQMLPNRTRAMERREARMDTRPSP